MKKSMRKKSLMALALAVALMVGMFCLPAYAASSQSVTAQLSPHYTIVVDGVERTFYNVAGEEVHPIVYQGTTYLPLRAIGELMDKNVNWDQSTKTATLYGSRGGSVTKGTPDPDAVKQSITASLRYDFTIVVDGVERTFTDVNGNTVYPLLYNGSTYLPLRAIGNLMGKTVVWDGKTCTATLGDDDDLLVTDADSFEQSGVYIGKARAQEIALSHAGLTAGQVTFVYVALKSSGSQYVYEVEFYTGSKEYDYQINASTGAVVSYDHDAEHYVPAGESGSLISESKAKEIALDHAGLTAGQVRFVHVELEYDDGRWEYEVEFYSGNTEYDYEINATTGKILSYDHDAEYYVSSNQGGSLISESEAKEIALERAGLKDNQIKSYKSELELDDGRWEYEIEFRSGKYEYELTIDASTGAILSYDKEWD